MATRPEHTLSYPPYSKEVANTSPQLGDAVKLSAVEDCLFRHSMLLLRDGGLYSL